MGKALMKKKIETLEELRESAEEEAYAFVSWFIHQPEAEDIIKRYEESLEKNGN